MAETIKKWCEEAMLREIKALKYTDKDGITHNLMGNQPIYTCCGNPRNNAVMNVYSINDGRTYHIDVKAYSSVIAHLVVKPINGDVYIAKATVTSRTDARILSEVARTLRSMGAAAWFHKAGMLNIDGSMVYNDFKTVAKEAGHYSIRHDRPLLRKGGYC